MRAENHIDKPLFRDEVQHLIVQRLIPQNHRRDRIDLPDRRQKRLVLFMNRRAARFDVVRQRLIQQIVGEERRMALVTANGFFPEIHHLLPSLGVSDQMLAVGVDRMKIDNHLDVVFPADVEHPCESFMLAVEKLGQIVLRRHPVRKDLPADHVDSPAVEQRKVTLLHIVLRNRRHDAAQRGPVKGILQLCRRSADLQPSWFFRTAVELDVAE